MILAIETSCDDSALALLSRDGKVVFSHISSQVDLHRRYGGIVPEIASRKHLTTLPLLIKSAMRNGSLSLPSLQAIAVTYAPGLIGSLLVGVNYAKTLAWQLGIPLYPVDHLEGHLLAPFLDNNDLKFPYLALVASGGHTHLIQVKRLGEYRLLGKTMDDAAGEAYDKAAKMLGFQYPGGPVIEQLAALCPKPTMELPIPLKGKGGLNFSFSGLKTAVRNAAIQNDLLVENSRLISFREYLEIPDQQRRARIAALAASFQSIMTVIITRRMEEALKKTGLKRMAITGGVAANTGIRKSLAELADRRQVRFFFPRSENCTDNAAMIGYTAVQYMNAGDRGMQDPFSLNALSKSPLGLMEIRL